MPTELIGDTGFGGRNKDVLFVATGTAIPDFLTAKLNRTIKTTGAGSIFKVTGLGVRSGEIGLPTL